MSDSILDEFSVEALDLLEEAEEALLSLEADGFSEENYNKIFRAFHSLKGSAGMMGLLEIQKHMHLAEDLFQNYKEDESSLIANIDFFLNAVDHTKKLLNGEVISFKYDLAHGKKKEIEIGKEKSEKDLNCTQSEFNDVFIADVIGEGFTKSDLFKKYEKNFIINKVEDLNKYLRDKKYTGSHCLIVSKSELLKINLGLSEPIPKFVFSASRQNGGDLRPGEYQLYNEMDHDYLLSTLTQMKHHMNLYKAFDKALKLLYYQYSDLDRFLKEQGREMIRRTLKSEMKNIMKEKNEVFKQ